MSFSNEIKNELAHLEQKKKCCEIAELAGLVRMDGTILIGSRKGCLLYTSNGIGAGWRFAVVAAGLQRYIHGCAPGGLGAGCQSIALCVQLAAALMITAANNAALFHDNCANHGIGRCPACAFLGKLQRQLHIF